MRRLLAGLVILGFSCAPPPAPTPAPAPQAEQSHGLATEEEARILALEDRREFDAALAADWAQRPNPPHRARLALALGRIGPITFDDTNKNGEKDPNERQAGVDQLIALAGDPEASVRMNVAFALGEIGDTAGIDALFKLAADENASVGAEAAEALSKIAQQVPLTRYAELTSGGAEGVRARAIRFLFRFNTDEASAIAASLLDSNSAAIRQESAYSLARRAYAPSRQKLALVMSDSNVLTRAYAATALGRIGSAESAPLLIQALGDLHPWVRTNAVVALARIGAKDASFVAAADIPRLMAITEDPDPGTRASAIDTLGYYATRNDTAKKKLLDMSTNGSRWERELAAGAITKHFGDTELSLLPKELSPWAKVRVLEAAALLKTNGPVIRKRFAADPESLVRENVIANIPDDAVDNEMDLIRPALTHVDAIVRSNALGKYAVSKATTNDAKLATFRAAEERARGDRENDARLAAIAGLADIDYPEREAFLRGLLQDKDFVVRRAAADLIHEKLKKNRPQYTPLPVARTAEEYARIVAWSKDPHTATIHMTRGLIKLALLAQDAPLTAWNFAELAGKKYFDNTSFMRVVPNFVIQGGDPRNDQNGGPGYSIRDEINLQKYTRGALGMALSGPDTGGSQFFITHSPQPHLDGGYTIFGRVYSGMNGVVDVTERGDRVETITIDESAPAVVADILDIQSTPLPVRIGRTNAEWILQNLPEYADRKRDYKPDETVVEMIADAMKPGDRVEIYMGTWCPDSQREVPKYLKIADILKARFGKELPTSFVAIDKTKLKPEDLLSGKHVEKLSTFVFYRGNQEIGRIVERPNSLLEDDFLAIVARPKT